MLTTLPEVSGLDRHGSHVVVTGSGQLVNAVISTLAAAGITANDVEMESATLEDAFMWLTGSHLHDPGADADAAEAAVKPTRKLVRG
jgi:ABC-2 type transport system ATP-binding protein